MSTSVKVQQEVAEQLKKVLDEEGLTVLRVGPGKAAVNEKGHSVLDMLQGKKERRIYTTGGSLSGPLKLSMHWHRLRCADITSYGNNATHGGDTH